MFLFSSFLDRARDELVDLIASAMRDGLGISRASQVQVQVQVRVGRGLRLVARMFLWNRLDEINNLSRERGRRTSSL